MAYLQLINIILIIFRNIMLLFINVIIYLNYLILFMLKKNDYLIYSYIYIYEIFFFFFFFFFSYLNNASYIYKTPFFKLITVIYNFCIF